MSNKPVPVQHKSKQNPRTQTERNVSIVECHQLGMGHAEIARDFAISRERVRQIIKAELGSSVPMMARDDVRHNEAIRILLEVEAGRSIDAIAGDCQLSVKQVQRLLQEQLGLNHKQLQFKVWMGEQLGQRFGDWLVLAIKPCRPGSTSMMRCRVTMRCERCNTVHTGCYRNLADGRSTMCHRCSCKNRQRGLPVQDMLSGRIYDSPKAAAAAQGLSYDQVHYGLRRREPRFRRLAASRPVQTPVVR